MSNGPPNFGNSTAIPLNTFQQNIANGNANNQTSAMNGTGPPNQVAPSSSGLRRALTERQINIYGKIEAVVGYFKMLVLCGLILLMLIIADGNARRGQTRIGFSAGESTSLPRSCFQLGARTISGPAGQFLLTLNVLSTALFSYVGMEIVAVAVGEAKYLDQAKSPESIKVGTRKIYIRVIVLYLASIIAMSFPVWSTNPNLKRDPRLHDGFEKSESATSPFLIAIIEAGIPILPHILNAFFVFSGFASAVNSLYVSSRILYSLAKRDMVWPKSFQKRLKVTCRMKSLQGIPSAAVGTGWIVALVSIVGIWQEPSEVFRKFSTNAVVSAQIVNCCICLSYIRYYR
ncbi:hypothetical protein TWF191_000688 [Orbilia oligospora]|uniref:Amino acid permease/ SLC12A domain-containing protein n=1 Tax=Orbilia oligospora TaxID=2813651 RepID=A0A7C8UBL4_ORBOL|nr:hypothetical protein TWF191_000688 [Orbilia oligospora]